MKHRFEVYQCPPEHLHAGMWTFRIDGKESLYYSPLEAGAERAVSRLQSGKSRAFRSEAGKEPVAAVEKTSCPTTGKRRWKAHVHGQCCHSDLCTSEREAKSEAAIAAFMGRGKLGKLDQIRDQFRESVCSGGEVQIENGEIIAIAGNGQRHLVGCTKDHTGEYTKVEFKVPGELDGLNEQE